MYIEKEGVATGIEDIDRQHEGLFELFHTLQSLSTRKVTIDELSFIFRSLEHYIRDHFHQEEKLMQEINYPKYKAHKKAHSFFEMNLNSLKERVEDMHIDNLGPAVSGLIEFLNEWLVEHIQKTDMDYVKYMEDKKAGA